MKVVAFSETTNEKNQPTELTVECDGSLVLYYHADLIEKLKLELSSARTTSELLKYAIEDANGHRMN